MTMTKTEILPQPQRSNGHLPVPCAETEVHLLEVPSLKQMPTQTILFTQHPLQKATSPFSRAF